VTVTHIRVLDTPEYRLVLKCVYTHCTRGVPPPGGLGLKYKVQQIPRLSPCKGRLVRSVRNFTRIIISLSIDRHVNAEFSTRVPYSGSECFPFGYGDAECHVDDYFEICRARYCCTTKRKQGCHGLSSSWYIILNLVYGKTRC
jgi:hypothetical protein